MRDLSTPRAIARVLSRRDAITVHIQGNTASTNGRIITIPDLGNRLDGRRITLLYGYLFHEIGHCRYSDFRLWQDRSLSPELRSLTNLLEDIAVETYMGREYPGCLETLTLLNSEILENLPDPLSSLLLNGLKLVSGQPLAETPDPQLAQACFGEDVFDLLAETCEPASCTADRLDLARLLLARLKDRKLRRRLAAARSAGDCVSGETTPVQESHTQSGDPDSAQSGNPDKAWDETTDGETEALLEFLRNYKDLKEGREEKLAVSHREAVEAGEYLVYSREEDRFEPAPQASSDKEYFQLRERCARPGSRFVRLFRSEHTESWVTGLEQGAIDARCLYRVRVGDFKVFKQRRRVLQDVHETAVSFLMDCSGSMSREGRIENAMTAVVLFLESLTRADVASEVLGYTTCGEYAVSEDLKERYGRVDKLQTFVFKSFRERLSATVRQRIAGYKQIEMSENCDVDSLLIAYERLLYRPEPRRILFVLTDGGVASNGNDKAGRSELARVVRAIEQEGLVELLAIDLKSGHTKGVFSRRIEVKNSKDLADELMRGLETHLLRSGRSLADDEQKQQGKTSPDSKKESLP